MMSVTERKATCPGDSTLTHILHGLSGEHISEVVEHVETCVHCQKRLEAMTAFDAVDSLSADQQRIWNRVRDRRSPLPVNAEPDRQRTTLAEPSADTAREDRTSPLPGERAPSPELRIPGYEVFEEIGRGGMGVVYRARHVRLDREVAVKVVHSSPLVAAAARFEREMRSVGRLSHPHLIQAHDAGEADGQPYLVMELLRGHDLGRYVGAAASSTSADHSATQLLAVSRACDAVRQAALGLQAAHDAGLVHRDVKPSNLMMDDAGHVRVLDLGLAHESETTVCDGSRTDNTVILGSLDYLAPEQGRDTHAVDARSDIYALGCTLFALLAGRPPFSGPRKSTASEKLLAHATDPRPDVRTFRPEVPGKLSDLVSRMMDGDPARRPSSAAQVAKLLELFCGDGKPPVRPRLATSLAGFGGLLLLGVIIVIRFRDGTEKRIEIEGDVDLVSVQQLTDAASVEIERTDAGFDRPSHPAFERLLAHAAGVRGLCLLSDERAVTISLDSKLRVWNLEDGSVEKTLPVDALRSNDYLVPSADGQFVYGKLDDDLTKFRLIDGRSVWSEKFAIPTRLAVSSSGQVVQQTANGLFLMNELGERQRRLRKKGHAPAFCQSGTHVAFVVRDENSVQVHDLSRPDSIEHYQAEDFVPESVTFARDDAVVVAVDDARTAVVWDRKTGQLLHRHTFPATLQQDAVAVQQGRYLVSLRDNDRDDQRAIVVWDPETGQTVTSIRVTRTHSFAVSKTGHRVLTCEGRGGRARHRNAVRVWRLLKR